MNSCPETGIGIVYLQGIEHLVEPHFPLLHTIELEPQTLWYSSGECDSFSLDHEQENLLLSWNRPILFHGVGYPIGGLQLPPTPHFNTIRQQAQRLQPLWMSEHLSFNCFEHNGHIYNTNLLLPPLQTEAGIATAVKGIRHYIENTQAPFAFETGTNYLRPLPHELPDGVFVRRIAEEADCAILLDLHNLLANEKNGRQSVRDFVAQLPLERIQEIHIANGFEYKGYYLDAHSGPSSPELRALLRWLVRQLPALKAIIFEMLPEYASRITVRAMQQQLEEMNRIWDQRGQQLRQKAPVTPAQEPASSVNVHDWENTLGKLAIGQQVAPSPLAELLSGDPGLEIIRDLGFHFRASMIVTSLKYTTRLLQLKLGEEAFEHLLNNFCRQFSPDLFPYQQAIHFAKYLGQQKLKLPYLKEILAFEVASLHTLIDHKTRSVPFPYNPFPVFRSLSNAEWPEEQDRTMRFVLEVKPDSEISKQEALSFNGVFHN